MVFTGGRPCPVLWGEPVGLEGVFVETRSLGPRRLGQSFHLLPSPTSTLPEERQGWQGLSLQSREHFHFLCGPRPPARRYLHGTATPRSVRARETQTNDQARKTTQTKIRKRDLNEQHTHGATADFHSIVHCTQGAGATCRRRQVSAS